MYISFLKKLEAEKGLELDIWCNFKPVSEALMELITKYLHSKNGSENFLEELTDRLNLDNSFLETVKLR
jgi:hypothetical protein